jgi:hypothetical protein
MVCGGDSDLMNERHCDGSAFAFSGGRDRTVGVLVQRLCPCVKLDTYKTRPCVEIATRHFQCQQPQSIHQSFRKSHTTPFHTNQRPKKSASFPALLGKISSIKNPVREGVPYDNPANSKLPRPLAPVINPNTRVASEFTMFHSNRQVQLWSPTVPGVFIRCSRPNPNTSCS